MITRDNIRDAASTLAHHWTSADRRDRLGVERLLLAYPVELQRPLAALILMRLEERGHYTGAAAFEALLFDLAGLEPEPRPQLEHGTCGGCGRHRSEQCEACLRFAADDLAMAELEQERD
jgi:hypothetical protein